MIKNMKTTDFSDNLLDAHGGSPAQIYLKISSDPMDAQNEASGHHWTRREKYAWFFTLLFGTTAVYASRTTMPLVAPAAAKDLAWTKTEVGTVLSCFFWGYTLTQILGGYLSDRFGAERVLLASGIVWGFITFWFHQIVYLVSDHEMALNLIVLSRVVLGAAQGVHFPALASISSTNLNVRDRSFFFSATTAGSAFGTLLTGTLGSYLNESFGWPHVFYAIGLISLVWVSVLKYYAMELNRNRKQILGLSATSALLGNRVPSKSNVPWLKYLRHPSLWACIVCHFCQNNCFFILLSWLPTYFHDNFPEAKSSIFNVVPWLLMVPGIVCSSLLSNRLIHSGYSVGQTRKIVEAVALLTEAVCLVLIGWIRVFKVCLGLTTLAIFASAFHKFGTVPNAVDIAPKHSGSVFGIVNTAGSFAGFVGVYIAGYILELSGSWSAVFNLTAVINCVGLFTFVMAGSGQPIL
ncbi:voltage-gated purine nucleotide uniporter SLC17A9-like isoform X2 [Tigriopus californicus]|uniref:voltage-gated purine nucleotide uniporter SLC17A9-like isoform X1 n=1 Tax=Tigriopus californicus TaxID=6832 RepID=UPI0027DA9577|nr:voltage-gated purine nucleotide uniporter SLC17A9-like isoform X1 [Tigriopus californicus]XP_059089901.1 voltage-gated purine nucleotide uniporter SLC17A9-like isoform X2 [Tigriopus californicus]